MAVQKRHLKRLVMHRIHHTERCVPSADSDTHMVLVTTVHSILQYEVGKPVRYTPDTDVDTRRVTLLKRWHMARNGLHG
jgi:hypothetical protein